MKIVMAPAWLWATMLAAITLAVYWPGLGGDFIFDDFPNLVTNTKIHAESLTLESMRLAAGAYEPGSYGRPLATISFAIDHVLGGKDPWFYKFNSLLVHLANALLVFALLRRLLPLGGNPKLGGITTAFVIALAWAAHPLQVSTVLYVVQRMETLSLFFVLLALLAYLRGRKEQQGGRRGWPWLLATVPLVVMGSLAKETAVLFPAYCLALELTVLRFAAANSATERLWRAAYGLGALTAALLLILVVLPTYATSAAFEGREFSALERVLTQLRVLPLYLQWMVLPLPKSLVFYYDTFPVSHSLLNPATTLAGGLFLAGLLAIAVYARHRAPLLALGLLWFFASHLITSNAIALELVFEHRNYFALLGVLLVLADLVARIPTRDGPNIKRIAVGSIVTCMLFLTIIRAASWGDPFYLAEELVANNFTSPRASSDLATLYAGLSDANPDSPFFQFAMKEFERGSRLPKSSPLPEQGLILLAATTGQPVQDRWWQSLIEKVQRRPVGPQEVIAVTGLMKQRYAGIAMDDQRLAQAYSLLLARGDLPAHLHAEFGDFALNYLHDEDQADAAFRQFAEKSLGEPDYVIRVAGTLVAEGHVRQAKVMLQRATELGIIGPEVAGLAIEAAALPTATDTPAAQP